MGEIKIDSVELTSQSDRLAELSHADDLATAYASLNERTLTASRGTVSGIVNSLHGEECVRVNTALTNLLSWSQQVLDMTYQQFTGTDNDLARSIGSEE